MRWFCSLMLEFSPYAGVACSAQAEVVPLCWISGRLSKRLFFFGFENMGDMGWAGNALFGPWGGVTWAQLRYAGDGDSQFAWGGHEKAEKRDRV